MSRDKHGEDEGSGEKGVWGCEGDTISRGREYEVWDVVVSSFERGRGSSRAAKSWSG